MNDSRASGVSLPPEFWSRSFRHILMHDHASGPGIVHARAFFFDESLLRERKRERERVSSSVRILRDLCFHGSRTPTASISFRLRVWSASVLIYLRENFTRKLGISRSYETFEWSRSIVIFFFFLSIFIFSISCNFKGKVTSVFKGYKIFFLEFFPE